MTPEPASASVHIEAAPERVFEFFTAPAAMLRWMGDRARLTPVPGGEFAVDIRGVPVRGRYLELDPPHRLLFSWGHAGSDRLPPGASTVEVRLTPRDGGTLVELFHHGLPAAEAAGHGRGWRMFLDRLAQALAPSDAGERRRPR